LCKRCFREVKQESIGMGIDTNLIDQLLAEHEHRPEDIAGETGLLEQLTTADS
jgi:hypothetical protein